MAQKTGLPAGQLSAVFVCRRTVNGAEKKQKLPINESTNFCIILNQHNPSRERDAHFLIAVKKSKRDRKGTGRKKGVDAGEEEDDDDDDEGYFESSITGRTSPPSDKPSGGPTPPLPPQPPSLQQPGTGGGLARPVPQPVGGVVLGAKPAANEQQTRSGAAMPPPRPGVVPPGGVVQGAAGRGVHPGAQGAGQEGVGGGGGSGAGGFSLMSTDEFWRSATHDRVVMGVRHSPYGPIGAGRIAQRAS